MIRTIAKIAPTSQARGEGAEYEFFLQHKQGVKVNWNSDSCGAYKFGRNPRNCVWGMAKVQRWLASADLAPRLLAFGLIEDKNGKRRWGITTEIARMPWVVKDEDGDYVIDENIWEKYECEWEILVEKLEMIGVGGDAHRFNVGIVERNGHDVMVLIDTGTHGYIRESSFESINEFSKLRRAIAKMTKKEICV
jgi:hypothetical protein